MPLLSQILQPSALAVTTLGAGYGAVVAVTALTAIAARTPERRRDARQVLSILLPRRRP